MTIPDAAGLLGVALIAGAYLALQTERLAPERPSFSGANALGAALILYSLAYDFNLSAAVIEGFWLITSLYGLLKSLARIRRDRSRDAGVSS